MICNFEKLCMFRDRRLDLSQQLEVVDHLDKCGLCLGTARLLKRVRDGEIPVSFRVGGHPAKKTRVKGSARA
jgi:hypothetical protein